MATGRSRDGSDLAPSRASARDRCGGISACPPPRRLPSRPESEIDLIAVHPRSSSPALGVQRPARAAGSRCLSSESLSRKASGSRSLQRRDAGLAAIVVEGLAQNIRSHAIQLVGLIDRALELHRPQARRLVDQRAYRRGEGDPSRVGPCSRTASVRLWICIPRSRLRLLPAQRCRSCRPAPSNPQRAAALPG